VASIDDVWSQVVLDQLGRVAGDEPALRVGPLSSLIEHDRRRSTRYVETLRAYLDAASDAQAAAASLDVHPNTFRYRLRRVTETPGLDLDNPVDRLVIHLQLRLMDRGGGLLAFSNRDQSGVGAPKYSKQRQASP
jgi:sugar diacid utilization regulator